jgi:calcium-dependent protein kinase
LHFKIGEGNFGVVHQARNSSVPGHEFAVKTIKKKNLSGSLQRVKNEIETLLSVDHPNIIKVYETFEDNDAIHIVMELCTGGEMMEIFPEDGSMPEEKVLDFIRSMLKAVNHIHQMGIIHRDLKPENFLFSRSQSPDELKLVDFGLSNKFTSKFEKLHSKVGTPYYIAPEVIQGTHNSKCDMWSIGIIFYIMLSGDIPFHAESVPAVFKKIMSGSYSLSHNPIWKDISEESKHLLSRLLCLNTHDRLSALEALMHPAIFSIPKPVNVNLDFISRLKKYSFFPLIKKCALLALVKYMHFDEGSWEKRVFLEYDLNLTGVVTPVEICDHLEEIKDNFSQFQVNLLMDKVGIRSNGKLYFNEFIGCLLESSTVVSDEVKRLAFSFFDRERKGFFDCKNLMDAFRFLGKNIGFDEANKMIKDVGKAGVVRFSDFKNLINNL